jgi:hypothetical protein
LKFGPGIFISLAQAGIVIEKCRLPRSNQAQLLSYDLPVGGIRGAEYWRLESQVPSVYSAIYFRLVMHIPRFLSDSEVQSTGEI